MFFEPEIETMKQEKLQEMQLERLKWTVDHAYRNVPFYQKKFDEYKVCADKIKSISDLQYFPVTTKEDLKNNYPFNMFAVPKRDVVRLHGSSGTTGKPTIVGYTKNDLDMWSTLVARVCALAGVTNEDVAQVAFGYGLFTGGFGLHQGLEKVGAMVVPLSSGNTEKQLMLMEDFGTTVLIATPSYALYLSELIRERGMAHKIRVGLFGGEGCTPAMRTQIEKSMGIIATDNYGMSELIGPGVAGECLERQGLHMAQDHFIPEIVDADTLAVKGENESGELLITSLTKECFPIIRYRTKDITKLDYTPCKCGHTHVRMSKIMGRSDDMLIIKGVNVFPSQIESAIIGMQDVGSHYMLIVRREGIMDTLEVQIELTNDDLLESYSDLKRIENNIKDRLKSILGLNAKVVLVSPNTIKRFEGKAQRVIDLRPKD